MQRYGVQSYCWLPLTTARRRLGTLVFTSNEPDGKMCFVASQPTDSKYSQTITSRDPVFFMITSIPAKKIKNEVSTIIGYAFGPNASVQLEVGENKYTLFTANTDGTGLVNLTTFGGAAGEPTSWLAIPQNGYPRPRGV